MTTTRSNDELFEYLRGVKQVAQESDINFNQENLLTHREPRSVLIVTADPSVIPISGNYKCATGNLATNVGIAVWALDSTIQNANNDRGSLTRYVEDDIDLSYLGDGFFSYAKLNVTDYNMEEETVESRWGPLYNARIDNLCFLIRSVPRYTLYRGYTIDIPLPRAHGGYGPYTYKITNHGQTSATTDGQLVTTDTTRNFRASANGKGSSSGTDTLYDYVVTDSRGSTATLTFQITYNSTSVLNALDEVSVSYLLPFRLKPQTYYGIEAVLKVVEPSHLSTRSGSVKLHSWGDDDHGLTIVIDPPTTDEWVTVDLNRLITSNFTEGDVIYVALTVALKPGYQTTIYIDRIYIEELASSDQLTVPTERPIVGSGITTA